MYYSGCFLHISVGPYEYLKNKKVIKSPSIYSTASAALASDLKYTGRFPVTEWFLKMGFSIFQALFFSVL
jgi:hypothetical protein